MFVPITGAVIEQQTNANSPYYGTQSGSALGRTGRPVVPNPLFATKLRRKTITPGSAQRIVNGSFRDFPVSWQYEFSSSTTLSGAPLNV